MQRERGLLSNFLRVVFLSEVVEMKAGVHISAGDISPLRTDERPFPCFGGNGIRGYVAQANCSGRNLFIGRQGALCGNVSYFDGQCYATEHAVVTKCSDALLPRFAFHLLTAMDLNQYKSSGAQPGLAVGKLNMIQIILPTVEKQKMIAEILDQFDALVDDISQGIPAEMEARRKQYAYYRDRLLAFKEKDAVA